MAGKGGQRGRTRGSALFCAAAFFVGGFEPQSPAAGVWQTVCPFAPSPLLLLALLFLFLRFPVATPAKSDPGRLAYACVLMQTWRGIVQGVKRKGYVFDLDSLTELPAHTLQGVLLFATPCLAAVAAIACGQGLVRQPRQLRHHKYIRHSYFGCGERSGGALLFLVLLLHARLPGVLSATFTTKVISQSNPLAGATNIITVSLVTDADLAATDSSIVTISGLSSAVATSPITLVDAGNDGEISFSDGTTAGNAAWFSGILTLNLASGMTLGSGTTYSFGFEVTNPATAQAAPTINIEASGTAAFAASVMTVPDSAAKGVTNGANALLVVVPNFDTKSIQQSTPVPGAQNTISITLQANCDLDDTSTVTISGLTASSTSDSLSLTVSTTSDALGTTAAWSQSSGELILTSTGTTSTTGYAVSFQITNPMTAQSSPAISVSATIEAGTSDASIAAVAMDKSGSALYGVTAGLDPMTVVQPVFSIKSIQQSTPVAGTLNTITVTVTANYNLEDDSTVTIAGLTVSQTAGSSSLPVTSTSNKFGVSGVWTQADGQLVLTAAGGGVASDTANTISFQLYNSDAAQNSPGVSIQASILDTGGNSVGSMAQVAMTKLGANLLGYANGLDPFEIVVHTITASGNAYPLIANSITVTGSQTGLYEYSGTARLHSTACEMTL
jgi:hypothetical protein